MPHVYFVWTLDDVFGLFMIFLIILVVALVFIAVLYEKIRLRIMKAFSYPWWRR